MAFSIINSLLHHATAQGSKSTVLRPLSWLLGMFVLGILCCVELKSPVWVLVYFAVLGSIAVLLFMVAYVFCLFRDRDALRSETYSIQKLAIEKGFYGDSSVGVIEGVKEPVLSPGQNGAEQE